MAEEYAAIESPRSTNYYMDTSMYGGEKSNPQDAIELEVLRVRCRVLDIERSAAIKHYEMELSHLINEQKNLRRIIDNNHISSKHMQNEFRAQRDEIETLRKIIGHREKELRKLKRSRRVRR